MNRLNMPTKLSFFFFFFFYFKTKTCKYKVHKDNLQKSKDILNNVFVLIVNLFFENGHKAAENYHSTL